MSTPPKRTPVKKVNFDDPILAFKEKPVSYEDPFFTKTPEITKPDTTDINKIDATTGTLIDPSDKP
jgi:hypothetical protein